MGTERLGWRWHSLLKCQSASFTLGGTHKVAQAAACHLTSLSPLLGSRGWVPQRGCRDRGWLMCALPPLLTIMLSTQKGKGPLPSFRSNLFSTPLFWEGPFVDLKVCPRPRLWGSQQPGTSHSRWSHCLDVATAMNKDTGASLSENSRPEAKAR